MPWPSRERVHGDETTVVDERAPVEEAPQERFIDPGPSYGEEISEEERLRVEDDRVEHIERRRRRFNPFADFWQAVSLLLLAALIAGAVVWYLSTNEQKTVPQVTSMPLDRAVTELQDEELKVDIVNEANAAPRGIVFEQRPSAGAELEEGSTVTVVVSKGPSSVTVPNAVGLPEQDARDRIAGAGLEVKVFEVFSDEPEGTVVAQSPGAGERVSTDADVRLNISKGSGLVDVPSLVGRQQADAQNQLADLGLEANVFRVPSIEPAGTVVAQNPAGGRIREGTAVRLNVSTGTPP